MLDEANSKDITYDDAFGELDDGQEMANLTDFEERNFPAACDCMSISHVDSDEQIKKNFDRLTQSSNIRNSKHNVIAFDMEFVDMYIVCITLTARRFQLTISFVNSDSRWKEFVLRKIGRIMNSQTTAVFGWGTAGDKKVLKANRIGTTSSFVDAAVALASHPKICPGLSDSFEKFTGIARKHAGAHISADTAEMIDMCVHDSWMTYVVVMSTINILWKELFDEIEDCHPVVNGTLCIDYPVFKIDPIPADCSEMVRRRLARHKMKGPKGTVQIKADGFAWYINNDGTENLCEWSVSYQRSSIDSRMMSDILSSMDEFKIGCDDEASSESVGSTEGSDTKDVEPAAARELGSDLVRILDGCIEEFARDEFNLKPGERMAADMEKEIRAIEIAQAEHTTALVAMTIDEKMSRAIKRDDPVSLKTGLGKSWNCFLCTARSELAGRSFLFEEEKAIMRAEEWCWSLKVRFRNITYEEKGHDKSLHRLKMVVLHNLFSKMYQEGVITIAKDHITQILMCDYGGDDVAMALEHIMCSRNRM